MKPTDITKLKHLAQDKISRSANPAIVRNSTVFFKNMQELIKQEDLVKRGTKVNFMSKEEQVVKRQLLLKTLSLN